MKIEWTDKFDELLEKAINEERKSPAIIELRRSNKYILRHQKIEKSIENLFMKQIFSTQNSRPNDMNYNPNQNHSLYRNFNQDQNLNK